MAPRKYPFKIEPLPTPRRVGKIRKDLSHYRHPHEIATARKLVRFGCDIVFLKPSDIPNSRTADCLWRNELWEMKSPIKNRADNIVKSLKEALPQSNKVIIDLSRSQRDIRLAAGDIIGYMRKRKRTIAEKVILLSDKEYCQILKSVVI